MLNTLVAEQAEKQARLKQLWLEKAVVQTVQSEKMPNSRCSSTDRLPQNHGRPEKTSGKPDEHRGRINGVQG